MRILSTKKKKIAAATLALVAIGGGAAVAYWTTDGAGAGSASTGTTQPITVNQTSTVANLAPGTDPQALSGNFDNPNSSSVFVDRVTAAVSDVKDAEGGSITGTCATDNFAITGTANVGAQVAAGDGVGSWSGLSIRLVNTDSNQDGCKNATAVVTYTVQ
ncbi:hypothetical protein [Pedococcus sp. 5OH_020]|uniref:hypothetical protein n=1 Tax=Pedococcus sp. 5OH_020 TaxID=2989814 RepID=UPI0022E9CAB1|nr:hypothetical protein [Pedococcus sp. 5OH_020]